MSASKDSSDPLYEIRTLFYIGNYQGCITEANKVKVCEWFENQKYTPKAMIVDVCIGLEWVSIWCVWFLLQYFSFILQSPSTEQKREITHFIWRAFVSQRRFASVLDEIRPTASTAPETLALRNYAAYLAAFYAGDNQKRWASETNFRNSIIHLFYSAHFESHN